VKRWAVGGVTEQVIRLSPLPVLPLRTETRAPRNNHVRRVVVPVDGSKFAEMALPWAIGLAKMLKARLVFLHVYPSGAGGLSARSEENFEALRLRMVRQTRLLEKQGVKARFTVRSGDAADRVLKFCGKNDLVITTTHGAGGFKRWIFGSVAEKLIHEARIPVLVYKTFAQLKGEILTA
jgi:nucleotide-binding universal stress UspA family protein